MRIRFKRTDSFILFNTRPLPPPLFPHAEEKGGDRADKTNGRRKNIYSKKRINRINLNGRFFLATGPSDFVSWSLEVCDFPSLNNISIV